MKTGNTLLLTVTLALLSTLVVQAQNEPGHIMVMSDALDWQPGPASLPPGAEFAILAGDPSEEGPFAMRLTFPAGYEIPAHMHPVTEHITVLQGTFNIGVGEVLERTQTIAVPAGGFVVMPNDHSHYVWTDEETIVQLHGNDPWGITYIDPENDPRNQ